MAPPAKTVSGRVLINLLAEEESEVGMDGAFVLFAFVYK